MKPTQALMPNCIPFTDETPPIMILAGDIGGTNTRLALFDADGGKPHDVREFQSRNYNTDDGLEQITADYLGEVGGGGHFTRACFGVAGPVKRGPGGTTARITNLAWTVDQKRIAAATKLAPDAIAVINDLAANAEGIAAVGPEMIVTLNVGEERDGTRAILSAGTGPGQAGRQWDERTRTHAAIPSEGGHASFGPRNDLEATLCRYLRGTETSAFGGHVSWERVLSGPGLFNIFDFHRHANIGRQSVEIPQGLSPGDAAKRVSAAGLDGSCERSGLALDLFVSIYGSAAGNLALTFLSLGGLYVGGGIAPKIIEKLKGPGFMEAFLDKGPMRSRVLEKVPVRVILDEHTALRGAAAYAARVLRTT